LHGKKREVLPGGFRRPAGFSFLWAVLCDKVPYGGLAFLEVFEQIDDLIVRHPLPDSRPDKHFELIAVVSLGQPAGSHRLAETSTKVGVFHGGVLF
jgi:hypothetical protein